MSGKTRYVFLFNVPRHDQMISVEENETTPPHHAKNK